MADVLPFPEPDSAAAPRTEADAAGAASLAAPYVGPRAFRPGEKLYGRDREAAGLMDVLISERIVLLHSPSGAGKTSLIQALLAPRLAKSGFAVYGPARVGSALGEEGTAAGANRYVLSAMVGMEKGRPEPLSAERLAGMTLAQYLDFRSAYDAGADPVLLFDQFEEILTLDANDVEAKTEFFRQVGAALRPRSRWALFAMREEFVATLDPYLHLVPTQLASRYPLQLLDATGARQAIEKPAEDARRPFTAEALDRLVDNLLRAPQPGSPQGVRGRWVEPVQLQVVCTRLWQKLDPETREIGVELVGGVADVDTALAGYYAETVAAVAAETGVRERSIRRWFEQGLISGDVRTQVARGGERAYGLTEPVVDALVNAYLVRREERRGSIWYELAHDRLMAPIRSQNADWFQETASVAQRQAAIWIGTGRAATALLRGRDIEAAERWLEENPDEQTDDVKELIAASRAFRRRQQRNTAIAATLLAAVLGTAGFLVVQSRRDAEQAKIAAVSATSGVEVTVKSAVAADRGYRASAARGDTIQRNVEVWYFPKAYDPDIDTALRAAGFNVEPRPSRNAIPTNAILYGDSVGAGTLRLLAFALLRTGVPLKGMCPLSNQGGRERLVQVLGVSDRDAEPTVTVDQVAAISDAARTINCPGTLVFQYGSSGDEEWDEEQLDVLLPGLRRAGYRVTPPQRTNTRRNTVLFYNSADRGLADTVAATVARLLGRPAPLAVEEGKAEVPPRRIEVLVDLSGRRPASRPPR